MRFWDIKVSIHSSKQNGNEESRMKRSYQYAGLQNPKQEGLSVDQCAARIHRFAYATERLMFLQAAHIISTPERDVKVLLARLQYENSQYASQFKARLPELRVSKKKAYQAPDASLQIVFDEAMYAANTVELLAGLTKVFKPALLEAYQRYIGETNGLADYPTVRILKTVIAEVEEGTVSAGSCLRRSCQHTGKRSGSGELDWYTSQSACGCRRR